MPSDFPAATVAERYRSLFAIGKGGMGTVEVALERSTTFERIVALKRLLPEAAKDKRHTDMFLREARLAALLNHPNVVHAFDFGAVRGELFLAMEYVEGEPLSNVIREVHAKEGALSPAIAAYILAEVCDGLHAAHELCDVNGTPLSVVHRDVSPHNVMVSYEGHVKLLDFGVAKIEDDRGVTRTGEVKGKTSYMSPEQAMGDKLDRRSDLYSLGSVLYECVAGRRMWGNGTDIEVIRRLALESPPRLEDAGVDAPKALCELFARLVAKDVKDRPATARAVSDELRAFVAETGTRPDARVLRTMMSRLFASNAESRKRDLTEAMAHAAATPNEPEQGRIVISTKAQSDPEAVTVMRTSGTSSAIVQPEPGRARSRMVVVALLATGLGAAAVVLGNRTPAEAPGEVPVPPALAASTPSAQPIVLATAPAPSAPAATVTATPIVPAAPATTSAVTTAMIARKATAPSASVKPKAPAVAQADPVASSAPPITHSPGTSDIDVSPLGKK